MEFLHSAGAKMSLAAVKRVGELKAPEKAWLVSMLGADVSDDAEVQITLRQPGMPAIPGVQASAALVEIMGRMEAKLYGVPDNEMEAALDEAMSAVRPQYRP